MRTPIQLPEHQLRPIMEERNRQLRRETRVRPDTAPDKLTAEIAAMRRRSRGEREPAPARTLWAAKLGIAR